MKTSRIFIFALCGLLALTSCEKFLDTMPDNRAEIDTEEKVVALLTSAYPSSDYIMLTEVMSDNTDNFGVQYKETDRFIDQVWAWEDVTESDNEDPESVWQGHYSAIAAANQALQAIEEMGGAKTTVLKQAKAEALLCRAYNHFMLVNLFCMQYTQAGAASSLGIPYLEEPEAELDPKYERGTVADVYSKIDRDLQEALPLSGDSYFTVPKYHFNQKAAYAFASRFYLYYEKWDLAERYATMCLGTAPQTVLRSWKGLGELPASEYEICVNQFISHTENANLLLMTAYSAVGLAFGPYGYYTKYSHGEFLADTETCFAPGILGESESSINSDYYYSPKVYQSALDRVVFWKLPYLFEITNPVAQIGYYRTVYPAVWTDEVLLNRAEAEIMQNEFDAAAADISMWRNNLMKSDVTLTPESIKDLYEGMEYYKWNVPTTMKHLNPAFDIGPEGELKERMLQALLYARRIETLGQGLRWFDIKRYGITIYRRAMNVDGEVESVSDSLKAGDNRLAIQIPLKVRDAGLQPNPRN